MKKDDKPTIGETLVKRLERDKRLKTDDRTCLAYIGGSGRSVSLSDLQDLLEFAWRSGRKSANAAHRKKALADEIKSLNALPCLYPPDSAKVQ